MLRAQTLENRSKERRIFKLNPQLETVYEVGGQSLREAEARIPKCADLRFRILGESLQEQKEKGDNCRRSTTSVDRHVQDQDIDLENVTSASTKAAIHKGPNYMENLEIYKNTNFEEHENLFDITQKLETYKQLENLNVKTIECTSASWSRSSPQILQKQIEDGKVTWKNFHKQILTEN